MFLMFFCSLLLVKRILLGVLSFCVGTFSVLQTLLPEVFSIVPFCICEFISFL